MESSLEDENSEPGYDNKILASSMKDSSEEGDSN